MHINQATPQAVNAGPYVPPVEIPKSVQPMPHMPQTQPNDFSSEPSMHTNAGDETLTNVTVMLDKESLRIIKEASAVHSESIVNLGIKLFAKTNVYKEFMLKPGAVPLDTKTEDLQTLTEAVAGMTDTNVPTTSSAAESAASAASTAPSGGFQTW